MTPEELVAAGKELRSAWERLSEIHNRAKTEGRNLSRREVAEVRELRDRADAINAKLPRNVGPRAQAPAYPTGGDVDNTSDRLKPEERVSDWLRERGLVGTGGYDAPERLSLGKAIRGAVTGRWGKDAESEQRALSESVLAGGGYLLGPALMGNVIDRLRNQMRLIEAGATTIPLTSEETYLARLATGTTPVTWHSENGDVPTSDMGFERIVFKPKTLPVIVKISAELFEDLSPGANDTIEHEIAQALSLELDRAALWGSGVDPEPAGIRNQSGVTITTLGSGNGDVVAGWDTLTDAVSVVRGHNVEPSAILWSSRTQQSHDKLKTSIGSYLEPPPSIAPIRRLATNQIPTNLHVGGSTDCTEVYVGRFSDVLIGIRTDMRLQVRALTERYIDTLSYGLLAYLRADVQLAHPESFNVLTGVRS
jgi:HK97 family phage major capsid protein